MSEKNNSKTLTVSYNVMVSFDEKNYDSKEELQADLDALPFVLWGHIKKGEGDNCFGLDIDEIEINNNDEEVESVKTAISMFINWYKETKGKNYDEGILRLMSLLKVERKQIIEAYNNGQTDAIYNKNVVDGAGVIYYDESFGV